MTPNADQLQRIRALLAKAEATTFEHEAEAFTAKAQELMARYRIEQALIDSAASESGAEPGSRRIEVPNPYASAKALLLAVIADANGCTAVWSKARGESTVFGFPPELTAVDSLFTSLLVQATAALQRHGSKRDRFGRNRTKRFRHSFLMAFAGRIGERLREVVDETVAQAQAQVGVALVPVLGDRAEAARRAADAAFPSVGRLRTSVSDGEGWYAGRVFADQAELGRGQAVTRKSA